MKIVISFLFCLLIVNVLFGLVCCHLLCFSALLVLREILDANSNLIMQNALIWERFIFVTGETVDKNGNRSCDAIELKTTNFSFSTIVLD